MFDQLVYGTSLAGSTQLSSLLTIHPHSFPENDEWATCGIYAFLLIVFCNLVLNILFAAVCQQLNFIYEKMCTKLSPVIWKGD